MNALSHVVVLVARPVVAHGGAASTACSTWARVIVRLGPSASTGVAASGTPARGLERGQRPAGVAAGEPHQVVAGLVGRSVDAPVEAPGVGHGARSSSRRRRRRSAARRVSNSERDSSGEMIENDGFSVVAAMRMTQRFSTPGSRASCWALVKRWISSRNRTVWRPYRSRLVAGLPP